MGSQEKGPSGSDTFIAEDVTVGGRNRYCWRGKSEEKPEAAGQPPAADCAASTREGNAEKTTWFQSS